MTYRRLVPVLALVALGAFGAGLCAAVGAWSAQPAHASAAALAVSASGRPNIIFVLTDDLSMDLLPYMPHVQEMERHGLSFSNYFVSDSLCCPSRSSIFTGNFPHDTGVFTNTGSDGGFDLFHARQEEQRTFAVALQRSGYRTAMMGKYLNGYLQSTDVPAAYVPPGWSEWDVAGWGYNEYDYDMNQNGTVVHYGHQPSDYLTNVVSNKGLGFIDGAAQTGSPFFLELATFSPHAPYEPAPADVDSFQGVTAAPEPPSFDRVPTDPPRWLARHRPLTADQLATIDRVFLRRVRSVQAVDRMIGQLEGTLSADGLANNTYLVFSSDNGLHTGEYGLMPGKLTAFDTDIRVPLVVVGPGVTPGVTTTAMSENIDLAETFAAVGGTSIGGDGHSLLPLFSGLTPADWRDAVLIEHHGPDLRGSDPDFQQPASGSPRTYEAMRTHGFLYVEYDDGEREFYDLQADPFELHNLAGALPPATLAMLHAALAAMENCHGGQSCWASMGGGASAGTPIESLRAAGGALGAAVRARKLGGAHARARRGHRCGPVRKGRRWACARR